MLGLASWCVRGPLETQKAVSGVWVAKATAACLVGTCSSGLRGGPARRAQSVRTSPSGRKQRPVPSALPCQPRPRLGPLSFCCFPWDLSSQNYLFTREALYCAELLTYSPSASEVTPFCITPPSPGDLPHPHHPHPSWGPLPSPSPPLPSQGLPPSHHPTLPGDLPPPPSPPPSLGTSPPHHPTLPGDLPSPHHPHPP